MQRCLLSIALTYVLTLASCQSPQPTPASSAVPAASLPPPSVDNPWRVWRAASQPTAVYALGAYGGQVWVGTSFGIWNLNSHSGEYTSDDRMGMTLHILPRDDGAAWATTSTGPKYFDGREWIALEFAGIAGQYPGSIYGMGIDRQGDLWLISGYSRSVIAARYEGHVPPATGAWPEKPSQTAYDWNPVNCENWQAFAGSGYTYRSAAECETLRQARQSIGQYSYFDVVVDAEGGAWWIEGSSLHRQSAGQSTLVELPVTQIFALAADPERGLWAGTDRGLARIDGSDIRWVPLGLESYTLRGNPHQLAIDTDGNAWVITDGGLQALAAGEEAWKVADTPDVMGPSAGMWTSAITAAPDGGIWASHGWDLWRFRVGASPKMISAPDSAFERCGDMLQLVVDREGGVWGAGSGCYLLQFIPSTGAWIRHTPDERIDKILLGANDLLYAQGSTGVWRLDSGGDWSRVVESNELSYNSTFAVDGAGRIWLHLWGTGELARYESGQRISLGACCRPYWMSAMHIDDNDRLWLAADNRLTRYDEQRSMDIPVAFADNLIEATGGPDGRLWVIGAASIAVLDPERLRR